MYVGKKSDQEQVPQYKAESTGTSMRVLIDKDRGADNFAMRVISVEPGGHIGLHNHPWEHEIYVINGKGEVRTDSEAKEMQTGNFLFIPGDELHSFYNTGDDTLEFICCIPKRPGVGCDGS
ncbi:MAG TPA: cupin domain-containing protein [bacterium]|jgi:quercetin dioxygenase-like cupin family protein